MSLGEDVEDEWSYTREEVAIRGTFMTSKKKGLRSHLSCGPRECSHLGFP